MNTSRIAVAGLGLVVITVLTITLWPTPVDQGHSHTIAGVLEALHRLGVPETFGYRALEFTANIVMFVPVGFFTALLFESRRVWWVALVVPLFSVLIEVTQALFLPERFATFSDVLANSLGGWFGLLVAVAVRSVVLKKRAQRANPTSVPRSAH